MEILFIFLGSILTFSSSWIVETLKNKRERKEKERNFKLFTTQEFKLILKGFDKLNILLENQNYYDTYTLTQLEKNIANLEGYKKEVVSVSNLELQEKYVDVISLVSTFIIDTRGLQNYYWNETERIKKTEVEEKKE